MTDSAAEWPEISRRIWDAKYRFKSDDGTPIDGTIEATWSRVADAAAMAERPEHRHRWAAEFAAAMSDFCFLPAGRILAGAGTGRGVTLFNCFVMGPIEDNLASIFDNIKEAALTMQQGGGIGHDFSTLRPRGFPVRSVAADASGPVSFMNVWDQMCQTIASAGQRRGAMMATLRADHPDIETFIDAKRDPRLLRNFNLSVLVPDALIAAVRADGPWELKFGTEIVRTVRARALWDRLMRATYAYAEPGVIFIDRINRQNNLAYCEEIRATNPCGEQPLPPYGACLLGSINLARLVEQPFSPAAAIDEARLERLVATAVRFLDDIIDVSGYPLPAQRAEALGKRRIGLGVTGLADALILVGLRYGSSEATERAARWMATIKHAAYAASSALAAEKGAFPLFDKSAFLSAPNVRALPERLRADIERHGIRNGLLTSIAPTGTISMLAGNVSSGIEPVFDLLYKRRVIGTDGAAREEHVEDYAHAMFRRLRGADAPLPPAFATVDDLEPQAHIGLQAAIQHHVDSAISKTINCPEAIAFDAFKNIYLDAHDLGLKGCTTYRPNAVTGEVLSRDLAHSPMQAGRNGSIIATPDVVPGTLPPRHRTVSPPPEPSGRTDRTPANDVVYLAEPLKRDRVLSGSTYKLRWPASDHAMYITINDIERDGRRRPFEIFINSKNLEHYAWTLALTRMISAIFRRGGDVAFVAEELQAVFDPQGGQWLDGRYVPSLLAGIGDVIAVHLQRNGDAASTTEVKAQAAATMSEAGSRDRLPGRTGYGMSHNPSGEVVPSERLEPWRISTSRRTCPRCSARDLVQIEGCWTCRACGFSKCG